MAQFTLGGYLTTFTPDPGSNFYADLGAHFIGFGTAMQRTPTIFGGAICANAFQPDNPFPVAPNNWPDTATFSLADVPVQVPQTTALMLTWPWHDDVGNTIYADVANGATVQYAGVTVDSWIQQTLDVYRLAGWNKLYLRPLWEWNIDLTNNQVDSTNISTFIAAWRHFYTVVRNYNNAHPTMTIKVCWNPSVFGQPTNTLTVAAQFPNQTVGDHFVDVICADFYAEGNSFPTDVDPDPTSFTVTRLVSMCQQWNLPFGYCELGGIQLSDFSTNPPSPGEGAAINFIPQVIAHLKSLASLTPAVPVEFVVLLGSTSAPLGPTDDLEWTAPGSNHPDIVAAWRGLNTPLTTATTVGVKATGGVGLARVKTTPKALTGVKASGAAGLPRNSPTMPSVVSVAGIGTPKAGISPKSLTGVLATAAVGTAKVLSHPNFLTGVKATSGAGSLLSSKTLPSVSATAEVGSLSIVVGNSVSVSGVKATSAVGVLGISHSIQGVIAGVNAVAGASPLSISSSGNNATLSGVQAVRGIGTLKVSFSSVKTPIGVGTTAGVGSLGISTTGAILGHVSGVGAIAGVGATREQYSRTTGKLPGVAGLSGVGAISVSMPPPPTVVNRIITLSWIPDTDPLYSVY